MINEELFNKYINRKVVIKTHNTEQYNILRDYVASKNLGINNLTERTTSHTIYNSFGYRLGSYMGYSSSSHCYISKGYKVVDFEDIYEGGEEDNKFDIFDYLK